MEVNTNSSNEISKSDLNFKDGKYATGKRKTSIARIWLKKGTGKIIVNGKQMQIPPKFSLKSLIIKLKIPLNKIAIELNKKIIDKRKISKIQLKKGDKIEIVHFIGGG